MPRQRIKRLSITHFIGNLYSFKRAQTSSYICVLMALLIQIYFIMRFFFVLYNGVLKFAFLLSNF